MTLRKEIEYVDKKEEIKLSVFKLKLIIDNNLKIDLFYEIKIKLIIKNLYYLSCNGQLE